jgi:hypothetical protein
MLRRKSFWLFAISLLSATSCTPKPPDVTVFKPLKMRQGIDRVTGHVVLTPDPLCMEHIQEMECCYGVSIVSGTESWIGEQKEHFFKGKSCSQLVDESIMLPAVESYAPLATYIIDSCAKMHCSDKVDRFKVKLDSLNGVSGAIKNH